MGLIDVQIIERQRAEELMARAKVMRQEHSQELADAEKEVKRLFSSPEYDAEAIAEAQNRKTWLETQIQIAERRYQEALRQQKDAKHFLQQLTQEADHLRNNAIPQTQKAIKAQHGKIEDAERKVDSCKGDLRHQETILAEFRQRLQELEGEDEEEVNSG